MHWVDWVLITAYMLLVFGMGLYFRRRAGASIESFFVSGRSLPWYIAGISMIATSFASDTPLWITSLVREYGVYYVWQYWAPGIGAAMAIVLFARLWRRLGVLTDPEMLELRYGGKLASVLRFWTGFTGAVFFCPLIIGWVVKAMEVITREAMGLPEDFRVWTTVAVIAIAVIACTLSGLWGVVYTDVVQFVLATTGTLILAAIAVNEVGGLGAMLDQLRSLENWQGRDLDIAPSIGSGKGQMSVWNAVGYFVLLWPQVALAGGYQAQRLLASRSTRHATYAMMLHAILYYAVIAWPWIIVALCSILILPDLGEGVSHDNAYPRMIVELMPLGLRGMLIVALLSAFMSTISTIFNWGSSYLVNDVYKRFCVREATPHHYVNMGRWFTLLIAVVGGVISFMADNLLQLLTIGLVLGAGGVVVAFLRWFWWRMNAAGELAAAVVGWVLAPLLLFAKVFDAPFGHIFDTELELSSDQNLLGARMLFMTVTVTLVAVVVALLTPPTPIARLRDFVNRTRPIPQFWMPVIRGMPADAGPFESLGRMLLSWLIAAACVYSLLAGIGGLLLGDSVFGLACVGVFAVTLWLTIRRVNQDTAADEPFDGAVPHSN
jgi:SSS family solute:Na+ symporter